MEGEWTNNITIFKLSSDLILLLGQSCLADNILCLADYNVGMQILHTNMKAMH